MLDTPMMFVAIFCLVVIAQLLYLMVALLGAVTYSGKRNDLLPMISHLLRAGKSFS
ncbi:MAG: hypothetical protein R2867_01590 [Caldilineaceae bacterium]